MFENGDAKGVLRRRLSGLLLNPDIQSPTSTWASEFFSCCGTIHTQDLLSTIVQETPRFSAAIPVVPIPEKGSITLIAPDSFIIISASSTG